MAKIIWADVTALAPELTRVADAARVFILSHVNGPGMDPASFDGEDGFTTRMARIYLAAHFGAGVGKGAAGVSGPVNSESMGGLSRSYGSAMPTPKDAWGSTAYGRQYEAMVNTSLARLFIVM